MRVVALAACVWVLAAQSASPALAADCTKGMLWPFVRAAGDCLTPEEIKAGQQGVYSGALNTNPDVANLKVETPVQGSAPAGGGSLFGLLDGVPSLSGDDAVYDSLGPAGLIRRDQTKAAVTCSKGALWPFYREPGDCLTDAEKRDQGDTVYRAERLAPTPASTTPGAAATANNAAAKPAASPAATCQRSAFWPFVRSKGDCQTEQEKKDAAANKQ